MRYALIFLTTLACLARAEEADDFKPEDALYAPEELTGSASVNSAAVSATATGTSYYSQAKISACDFTKAGRAIDGAEIFIDGQFMGKSPVTLNGYLISKPLVSLSARYPGYGESLRESVILPAEGDARIYLLSENAASYYTTPAYVIGLAAIAGSIWAYAQNEPGSNTLGLSLVVGGVGVMAVAQVVARFVHLPALEKSLKEKNASHEAAPAP